MNVIIAGAGRVGRRTACTLEEAGHDVVVIDPDPTVVERAQADGLEAVEGDGTQEPTLEMAGIEGADAFGALTSDLNDNFAACTIAKAHDCRTVMRIDEDYREDIYRQYADRVDEVVYPERLGAIAAKNALLGGNIRAIADVAKELQLVEFTLTERSPVAGYGISEVELPSNSRLLAFAKLGGSMRLPTPDESLEPGDELVVLADFHRLDDVHSLVVGETGQTALGGA